MLSSHNQQKERAEVQIQELSVLEASRLEALLSVVCHELKTPLTVLKGNIQLAEQKVKRFSIIERHHGQVGVESIIGKGATFWFTLPVATAC